MRSCPVCNNPRKVTIQKDYMHTPIDGVQLSLYECPSCQHHYLDDKAADQAWFDNYYLTQYRTDDAPHSDQRLDDLALLVRDMRMFDVLDIGGMDGELATRLQAHGVDALPAGVGNEPDREYSAVILSHTLEHIYDVSAMMGRIAKALKPGGLLFVEVPIWLSYERTDYDLHWQHVNKLRPFDLHKLFVDNDFTVIDSHQLPDYREYKVWRIVGKYDKA